MLELEEMCVRVDGKTIIEATFTAGAGRITSLVGRTGCGASVLLASLAGHAPGQAALSGQGRFEGRALRPGRPGAPGTALVGPQHLPAAAVADLLGDLPGHGDEFSSWADRRVAELPVDVATQLAIAVLEGAPQAAVVLADLRLETVSATWGARAVRELRRRAADGATVVWAEHALDLVWEAADEVVELDGGRVLWQVPTADWQPLTVPAPTLLRLARAAGLDPAAVRCVADAQRALGLRGALPPPTAFGRRGTPIATVPAEAWDVRGADVAIRPGETIGVVSLDGRPEPHARRLVHAVPDATVLPSAMPRSRTAHEVEAAFRDRLHLAAPPPGPATPELGRLSAGQLAAFRARLARLGTGLVWVPHPQAHLDPVERLSLATDLQSGHLGPRIVTTRDVEFLVRSCSRILVLDGNELVADASPQAAGALLPEPPLVSRVMGSARHLRLADVAAIWGQP